MRAGWFGANFLMLALGVQQQTGSPAGIPLPVIPASRPPANGNGATVFRVHVLDGRNGLPVHNVHIKLWYDEPAGAGFQLATDGYGYGNMPVPVGEPIRVLLAALDYTDCRKPFRGDPASGYNMSQIAKTGLATQNVCGAIKVHPQPGELLLFVRPARWYEGLNRNTGT